MKNSLKVTSSGYGERAYTLCNILSWYVWVLLPVHYFSEKPCTLESPGWATEVFPYLSVPSAIPPLIAPLQCSSHSHK